MFTYVSHELNVIELREKERNYLKNTTILSGYFSTFYPSSSNEASEG
jgi:hypothetical protein